MQSESRSGEDGQVEAKRGMAFIWVPRAILECTKDDTRRSRWSSSN